MLDARRRAIEWWVVLQSGTASASDRAQLNDWLLADPRHQEAWSRVLEVEQGVRRVPAALAQAVFKPTSRRAVLRGLGAASIAAPVGLGGVSPYVLATPHRRSQHGSGRSRHISHGARARCCACQ